MDITNNALICKMKKMIPELLKILPGGSKHTMEVCRDCSGRGEQRDGPASRVIVMFIGIQVCDQSVAIVGAQLCRLSKSQQKGEKQEILSYLA